MLLVSKVRIPLVVTWRIATFKKIESQIIDAYDMLSNPEDQELFFDYLIANLKLYFDKFESEIQPDVEEPSNQAYDSAKRTSLLVVRRWNRRSSRDIRFRNLI